MREPMYWVPSVVFLLHVMEEFPRFPAWASRHFGHTSRPYFVYSHIPLIGADLAISFFASTGPAGSIAAFLATGAQWVLVTNGLFHLTTTFLFREYSPGVVTGTFLFFPASAYFFLRTWREGLLDPSQLAWAIALGTLAGAAVIASLWLHMDLDWRLQRRPASRS